MLAAFVPGGMGAPELLIILVMIAFFIAIPVIAIVAVFVFLDARRGYDRRITALEERIEELENGER